MKHLLTIILVSVIAFVFYALIDWNSIDLSQSIPSLDNRTYDNQTNASSENLEESDDDDFGIDTVKYAIDDDFGIDTVMYANGHAFGYNGDIAMWGGWYLDTIFVGDDNMLQYDSVGSSKLKLSLVTRELIVDFGDADVADKIRTFMNPIKGFHRFQQKYEECLDSATDEKGSTWKYMGEYSFIVDYPDNTKVNASKINRFIWKLSGISENEKAKVPAPSAFYAGSNPTKNYRPEYTGNADDMKCLSEFLAHKTFENWIRDGEFGLGSSGSTLAIKPHIVNKKFITLSVYDYSRAGVGHGMYTETFHTFDFNSDNELTNTDIFKSQYLNKVKMILFEVMANDSRYRAWNGDSITPYEVQGRIEGWQSPDPNLEGTEWEGPDCDSKFELPNGALTDSGVVFSFQPYEIDCWAAGAYHFIVPYKKLVPYLTSKAKRLIETRK